MQSEIVRFIKLCKITGVCTFKLLLASNILIHFLILCEVLTMQSALILTFKTCQMIPKLISEKPFVK